MASGNWIKVKDATGEVTGRGRGDLATLPGQGDRPVVPGWTYIVDGDGSFGKRWSSINSGKGAKGFHNTHRAVWDADAKRVREKPDTRPVYRITIRDGVAAAQGTPVDAIVGEGDAVRIRVKAIVPETTNVDTSVVGERQLRITNRVHKADRILTLNFVAGVAERTWTPGRSGMHHWRSNDHIRIVARRIVEARE